MWRSMAGGMARKRPPKQKKTHVGPALLHALSSGSNPLDVPFNSTRVSRGLRVTGSGSHPRPHAGRPPSGTGLDARPLLLSLHVGASRQQAQRRQNTAGTAQGCWALLTQGHHTPATEGGKRGAAAGEGRPVSRPPTSWQRLPRVGAILTPSFGPRHQHTEKVPGGGKGRERASGVATHRSVTAWPAGPWPGASLGCPGPWPGLSKGLALPGRTANTVHKSQKHLTEALPPLHRQEDRLQGPRSYSPRPPGVAPAGEVLQGLGLPVGLCPQPAPREAAATQPDSQPVLLDAGVTLAGWAAAPGGWGEVSG